MLDNLLIPSPGGFLQIFSFCRLSRGPSLQMLLLQASLSDCEIMKCPVPCILASCILTKHRQSHEVAGIVELQVSVVIVLEDGARGGGGGPLYWGTSVALTLSSSNLDRSNQLQRPQPTATKIDFIIYHKMTYYVLQHQGGKVLAY